jgi:hypothetical protein
MRPVNDNDILIELDRRTKGYGTGARLAREIGIKASHLTDVKSGYRPPNKTIAAGLGFELRWVKTERGKNGN